MLRVIYVQPNNIGFYKQIIVERHNYVNGKRLKVVKKKGTYDRCTLNLQLNAILIIANTVV